MLAMHHFFMTTQTIKQLQQFATGTFALWPFDPAKDTQKIHAKLVILGLNPSGQTAFGTNFATRRGYGGKFDEWYKEGFSNEPFVGAYMTDLIPYIESKSAKVKEKWKKEADFRSACASTLRKQFELLGVCEDTPIMCIGKSTQTRFQQEFPNFRHVFSAHHPNSGTYRVKNNRALFVQDVARIGQSIMRLHSTD